MGTTMGLAMTRAMENVARAPGGRASLSRKPRVTWVPSEVQKIQDEMFNMLARENAFPLDHFSHVIFRKAQESLVSKRMLDGNRTREHLSEQDVGAWRKILNERGHKYNMEIYDGTRTPKGVLIEQTKPAETKQPEQQQPVERKDAAPLQGTASPLELIESGIKMMMANYLRGLGNVFQETLNEQERILRDTLIIVDELREDVTKLRAEVEALRPKPSEPSTYQVNTGPLTTAIDTFLKAEKVPQLQFTRKPRIAVVGLFDKWRRELEGYEQFFDIRYFRGDERPLVFDGFQRVYCMIRYMGHTHTDTVKAVARKQGQDVYVQVPGRSPSSLKREIDKHLSAVEIKVK